MFKDVLIEQKIQIVVCQNNVFEHYVQFI